MGRQIGPDRVNRARGIGQHPGDDRLRARARERRLTREHLVEYRRERVDVRARIDSFLPARLLRAHILGGTHRDSRPRNRRPTGSGAALEEDLGDAEVAHHRVSAGEQDVAGLDIAVNHPALMRVFQGIAHFGSDADRLLHREWSVALQPIVQRFALHVFHHIEEQAVGLIGFEQRHDVGVGELCGEQDFPLEPAAAEIGAGRGRQHFDGHPPAEFHVGGEVDGGHAAAAQLPRDGVAAREGAGQAVEQRISGHG